ncbi:MAG TPA: SMP-30/gluconolactonase/LRE family protein [Acidobacteriota bacterium]|nr:SMP-30/gluconolactonase/LRE family protein [Acidobacteriota bacterium]
MMRRSAAFFGLLGLVVLAPVFLAGGTMSIDDIIEPGTEYEVLGTGYGFTEGPAADREGNVYFSDGQNNTIYFYKLGNPVSVFVNDSTDANGMMFNYKGELVVCEGAAFRIVAFNVNTKEKRVLASEFEGLRFNEPNDLTVDTSNGFYFTDPNYRHRGQDTVRKEDTYYVFADGKVSRVSTVCQKPNGILLNPDNKILYLADNRGKVIYRYDVIGPGQLTNETRWAELTHGPDGMTLDEHGNLYIGCGGAGVMVYSPEGKLIGTISVPYASNVVFGGRDFSTLFITSRDKFLSIKTKVKGIRPPGADR